MIVLFFFLALEEEKLNIDGGRKCSWVPVMCSWLDVLSCMDVSRSTHQTDTTWCPSSRPPTLSRTQRTMCPHQHAPSWAKSSNTVCLHCALVKTPNSIYIQSVNLKGWDLLLCKCWFLICDVSVRWSGLSVTDEILQGKAEWPKLFEPPNFFSKYK